MIRLSTTPPCNPFTPLATVRLATVGLATVLLSTLTPPAPLTAQDAQDVAGSDWDVTLARGETREIDFTTEEGTWMSMDISPDGQGLADSQLIGMIDVTGT